MSIIKLSSITPSTYSLNLGELDTLEFEVKLVVLEDLKVLELSLSFVNVEFDFLLCEKKVEDLKKGNYLIRIKPEKKLKMEIEKEIKMFGINSLVVTGRVSFEDVNNNLSEDIIISKEEIDKVKIDKIKTDEVNKEESEKSDEEKIDKLNEEEKSENEEKISEEVLFAKTFMKIAFLANIYYPGIPTMLLEEESESEEELTTESESEDESGEGLSDFIEETEKKQVKTDNNTDTDTEKEKNLVEVEDTENEEIKKEAIEEINTEIEKETETEKETKTEKNNKTERITNPAHSPVFSFVQQPVDEIPCEDRLPIKGMVLNRTQIMLDINKSPINNFFDVSQQDYLEEESEDEYGSEESEDNNNNKEESNEDVVFE